MDGDEQVIEAAAQRTGHVLGADGVQQLLVIHVVAQDVRAPVSFGRDISNCLRIRFGNEI